MNSGLVSAWIVPLAMSHNDGKNTTRTRRRQTESMASGSGSETG